MEKLETNYAKFENILNWCGYFQFPALITAPVRFTYGLAQTVYHVAMGIFYECKSLWDQDNAGKFEILANRHWKNALHGLSNMGRAMVEETPFGGVACFIYDWILDKRHHYESETIHNRTDRIKTILSFA